MKKDTFIALILWCFVLGIAILFYCKWNPSAVLDSMPFQGYFFAAVSAFLLLYTLFCASCAVFYRPEKNLEKTELPGCTVIVPAYNEGEHVAVTLESLLNADYPADKLQIIAINDGSKDDTMEYIRSVQSRSGGRIDSLDLKENGGKKHALYRGFHLAKHDIVITVDSDSIVTKESLCNMVSAFRKKEVGAVAGNIRIKNLSDGMIPKMMDVGFMFGFELIRSAQSLAGCVMCTPGALSAYRKSIVMPFLDAWLHQSFLGAPAVIGEDRALATMILQHGSKVTFQSNAVAATCIPHTYGRFCKMLLRWIRSDVRENLLITLYFIRNMHLSWSRASFAFHLGALIVGTLMPLVFFPLLIDMCFRFTADGLFQALYCGALFGFLSALIPAMIYAKRVSVPEAVWAVVFTFYNTFLLGWIPVYAFFTARNSSWLTRELQDPRKKNGQKSNSRCKADSCNF